VVGNPPTAGDQSFGPDAISTKYRNYCYKYLQLFILPFAPAITAALHPRSSSKQPWRSLQQRWSTARDGDWASK
jgi:hypothetical protein